MRRYYLIKPMSNLATLKTRGGKIRITTPNQIQLMHDKKNKPYYIFNKDIKRNHRIAATILNGIGAAFLIAGILFLMYSYLNDSTGYYGKSDNGDMHYEWIDESK